MKLPNSLTAPSNRGDVAPVRRWWKEHRWTPAILTLGWVVWGVWPVIKDFRAIVFLPFGLPLGFIHWLGSLGVPPSLQLPISVLLLILMLSLPWFSLLANSVRASTICTIGVAFLLLAQIAGCHAMEKKMRSITSYESVGLERNDADHAQASLGPRLASIKARNCSSVSARDGSRSKRSQRASNSRFSASVTSCEPPSFSMGVGRFMSAASSFLSPSQPCSHLPFAS